MLGKKLLLELPDPALTMNWRCIDIIKSDQRLRDASFTDIALPKNFLQYIHGVSLPIPNIETNPAFRQASQTYFPGFEDVNSMSITFYEDKGWNVHQIMQEWRRLVRDPEGNYGLPGQYKVTFVFALCSGLVNEGETPDNEDYDSTQLLAYAIGCFPTAQSPTDLNYTGTERLVVSQEFSVDDLEFKAPSQRDL